MGKSGNGNRYPKQPFDDELPTHVDYCEIHSDSSAGAAVDRVLKASKSARRRSSVKTDTTEARLIAEFAALAEAAMILDISSSGSMVAATVLEYLPMAQVVSIETGTGCDNLRDTRFREHALSSVLQQDFPVLAHRLVPMTLEPIAALRSLKGKRFDIIYISDHEAECSEYIKAILSNHLLGEMGSIICSGFMKPKSTESGINGARLLNNWVWQQDNLEQILVPLCFGISFIRHRQISHAHHAEVEQHIQSSRQSVTFASKFFEDEPPTPKTPGVIGNRSSSAGPTTAACMSEWWDATSGFKNVELPNRRNSSLKRRNSASRFMESETSSRKGSPRNQEKTSVREPGSFSHWIDYCRSRSTAEGESMRCARKRIQATKWDQQRRRGNTLKEYTTASASSLDPLGAMLVKQIVHMVMPRRVLDIGMAGGYVTCALLESSLACAHVVSVEADLWLTRMVQDLLKIYPRFAERHKVFLGSFMSVLPELKEKKFDLIYINVDKDEYYWCVLTILKHELLSEKGVIICNGVLHDIHSEHTICTDPPCELHRFNQWVYENDRLKQRLLPISYGLSIIWQSDKQGTSGSVPRDLSQARPLIECGARYIVSGSTEGIGRSVALELARSGARGLLLHSTEDDEELAEEVLASIRQVAPSCLVMFHVADLQTSSSCTGLIDAGIRGLGGLEGFCNCAVSCFPDDLQNSTISESCAKASFLLTQSVTTHLKEQQRGGCVINILPLAQNSWIGPRLESMELLFKMESEDIRLHTIRMYEVDDDSVPTNDLNWVAIKAAEPFEHFSTSNDLVRTVGSLLAPADAEKTDFKIDNQSRNRSRRFSSFSA